MFFKYHHPQRSSTSVEPWHLAECHVRALEEHLALTAGPQLSQRPPSGADESMDDGTRKPKGLWFIGFIWIYMDLWTVSNYLWTEIIRLPLHDGSPNSPKHHGKMSRFTTIDRTNCKWGMGWSFLGLSDDFCSVGLNLQPIRCPILIETKWNYDICVAAVQPFGNRICGKCQDSSLQELSGFRRMSSVEKLESGSITRHWSPFGIKGQPPNLFLFRESSWGPSARSSDWRGQGSNVAEPKIHPNEIVIMIQSAR